MQYQSPWSSKFGGGQPKLLWVVEMVEQAIADDARGKQPRLLMISEG